MGKAHYGEFKFGKGGSSLKETPKGGDGRRLVQFYAGGGKVKQAKPAKADFRPAGAPKAPTAPSMPKGALGALASQKPALPPKPKGVPDFMARARIPGGMKEGGKAHSDVAMDKKLIGKAMKADEASDKRMVKAAVHKHERGMHPDKPVTKLARGGVPAHKGKPMYGGGKC
jgi:hypothetical protein